MEVLNGSCVTIPCSFDVTDEYQSNLDKTCRAIWFKGFFRGPIVFDSSDAQGSTIQGNLNGDLLLKDCTTTLNDMKSEHTDDYFFRVECDNPLKYTYYNQLVQISVKDDPQRPTLTPSTLEVTEGTSVSLTCSAPAPCQSLPPTLTWTPGLGQSQETLQENQDKTKVQTSVVNFTASHLHNRLEISCTAVYRKQDGSTESSVSSSLTAEVTYPPKDTTVSASLFGPVKENTNVTLTCSSYANPAVRSYTWHRADGGLEVFIGTGRVFKIQASEVSDPVFCKAENELGAGKSDTVHLDVCHPPKDTTVSVSPSGPVQDDTNVTLTCSSFANPAVRNYTWYRADGDLEVVIGTGRVFSILASKVSGPVFCKAENELGAGRSRDTEIEVQHPPKDTTVSVSPSGLVQDDTNVTLTCSSFANPAVRSYTWYRADGDLEVVIGTGRVFNIQASKDSGPVFCKAENELGAGKSVTIHLDVRHPPKDTRVSASPSGPVQEDTNVILTCSSYANPAVRKYTWYRADGDLEVVIGAGQILRFKALKDSGPVFCKAENELGVGRSNHTQIDVQYPPKDTTVSVSPSGLVNKGTNVTLTCSSGANPAVRNYTWYRADEDLEALIGTGQTLRFKALKDSGPVFCKAENELGAGRSNHTQIDVQYPPQILSSSDCTKTVDHLNCSCNTSGDPAPTLRWYMDGSPANNSDSFAVRYESTEGSGVGFISVSQAQWKDEFTLLCSSSNSLGSAAQRFYFFLEPQVLAENSVVVPILITTVVALLVLVCALLFVIRAHTSHHKLLKGQSSGNGSTAGVSQLLPSREGNEVFHPESEDKDIYVNTVELKEPDVSKPATSSEPKSPDMQSSGSNNAEGEKNISGETNAESKEIIYSSVIWRGKNEQGEKADNAK
ncbi:B-cell receptor CD22-like [Halichoeres trimaculatus]|uniref:B-cell receptor CD22-like n=1 Tax=Halichoeres trimaculatus TaxID=147232 RepID=UPI003D9E2047